MADTPQALAERVKERLQKYSEQFSKNSGVLVGIPKGQANYEDGAPLAVIAAVQEFGSADSRVPERSFLRIPLASNQERFIRIWTYNMPKVARGEMTMFQFMGMLGEDAVRASVEAIESGIEPPNAPSTIKRKKSDTPLIDSGRLRNSIQYQIED